jgi:hypothetical protein
LRIHWYNWRDIRNPDAGVKVAKHEDWNVTAEIFNNMFREHTHKLSSSGLAWIKGHSSD